MWSKHYDPSKRSWRLSSSTYICFGDRLPRPLSVKPRSPKAGAFSLHAFGLLSVPANDLSCPKFVSGHLRRSTRMTNLLERAISTDDADRAAKIIQSALGIESDEVANYCFPRTWPKDREQRARIIGDWLRAEARYLA